MSTIATIAITYMIPNIAREKYKALYIIIILFVIKIIFFNHALVVRLNVSIVYWVSRNTVIIVIVIVTILRHVRKKATRSSVENA